MLTQSPVEKVYHLSLILLALVIAIFLLVSVITVSLTQGTTVVWLQPSTDSIHISDTFSVTIRISDVVDLYGAQIALDFNPSDLQVIDGNPSIPGMQISPGECPITDFLLQNTVDNVNGTISYTVSQLNPTPPITGDCVVASVVFEAQQVVTTTITFDEVILSDPNGQPIIATLENLTLTILPPPPIANFTAVPTSGIAPLDIQFSDQSSGTVNAWLWNFGDGSTSPLQNPGHTYESSGNYTVSLTSFGPGGSHTLTRTNYINIYEPVTAEFSGNPTVGSRPLLVNFTNLSLGAFDTCLWDFGDGNTSDICINPSHTYPVSGTYTVGLTVDGLGGIDIETKNSYIVVEQGLVTFLPVILNSP